MLKTIPCLMCLTLFLLSVITISIDNYGPFDVRITKIKACKGPKRKDCCINKPWLNGTNTFSCDLVVKQNIEPTRGTVYATHNNKDILKMQMDKPCSHIFMRPVLNTIFKVTDNCVILKGRYIFHLNLLEVVTKYYGGSFIYGNWTYKMVFLNDECNFTCTIIDLVFTPKKIL